MTLDGLVAEYYSLMGSTPSAERLAAFSLSIPGPLQVEFLRWLLARRDQLESQGLCPPTLKN